MRLFFIFSFLFLNFTTLAFAQSPKQITVLELLNQTSKKLSAEEINYLSDVVREVIGYLPKTQYSVMTKENMELLIPKGTDLESLEADSEIELGQQMGARWLVSGQVRFSKKKYQIDLMLYNIQSGKKVAMEHVEGKDLEKLETGTQIAALKLSFKISKTFHQKLLKRTGKQPAQQLKCLMNPSEC